MEHFIFRKISLVKHLVKQRKTTLFSEFGRKRIFFFRRDVHILAVESMRWRLQMQGRGKT